MASVPVDLREDGVLWAINRLVFHPRGFAMAVDTETGEFSLLGDGTETFRYVDDLDDDRFKAFEALLDRARGHES